MKADTAVVDGMEDCTIIGQNNSLTFYPTEKILSAVRAREKNFEWAVITSVFLYIFFITCLIFLHLYFHFSTDI